MNCAAKRWVLGAAGLPTSVAGLLLGSSAIERKATRRVWRELETRSLSRGGIFEPEMIADLPEPAQRYLLHAIAPGTPLASRALLEMDGSMRLTRGGPWMPLRARQILAPPRGLVWKATVRHGLLRLSGADWYARGTGRTAFRLWGLIPVVRSEGADIARSARGRLAGEAIWNPASLLPQRGARWEAVDPDTARVTLPIDGEEIPITLSLAPGTGRLRSVVLPRWGDKTESGAYAAIPFGVEVLEEATFAGYTIPSHLRGGWWYGTPRYFPFADFVVRHAQFR